ncbi:MAG: Ig-like domain-containing protein [Lachnospiraceae bacterium]|nr:Ig-like domain-containing protein [Lachnospiraceae bacterium]
MLQSINVKEGKTKPLTIKNTKMKKWEVVWESEDNSVVGVLGNGKIIGVSRGRAVVKATLGGVTLRCLVTVN